jgi:peptide-methionine (S)-S-oxide reductase
MGNLFFRSSQGAQDPYAVEEVTTSTGPGYVPPASEASPAAQTTAKATDVQAETTMPALTFTAPPAAISDRACFGCGCYWGTEKYFTVDFCRRMYPEAMLRGKVGFMGGAGAKENPTYKEVCSGETGHVEVYDFKYKGGAEMYRELVKFMFQMHDPTVLNQQGNDRGPQYASVIFAYDSEQKAIANEVISELQSILDAGLLTCHKNNTVTTAVLDASEFYPAHEEHQEYLAKNPNGYCNHRIRFKQWPALPSHTKNNAL